MSCACFPANAVCPSAARCDQLPCDHCGVRPGHDEGGNTGRLICTECLSAARRTQASGPNPGLEAPEPKVNSAGHPVYIGLLAELRELHVLKSSGYGTSGDPMANFTSVADLSGQPRYLYPVLRSIEKLTRVLSLHAQGRVGELGEELLDVSSLMLCGEAMRREDS